MPHPEEGTVHAWLDGALAPVEAAAFEARVAAEPELQAAVAEARGLIAASARILGALDAVPGNVLPKQAPAGTVAGNVAGRVADDVSGLNALRARAAAQSAAARVPRRWRAQSWAAAAMIVVAVGAGVVWKSSGEPVTPADLAVAQAARSEPAADAEKPGEVARSTAVAPTPAPALAPTQAPIAAARAPLSAGDQELQRSGAGFAAKKSVGAAQDAIASKAAADAKGPSSKVEATGAAAPMAKMAEKLAEQNAPSRDRAAAVADEAREKVAPIGELKVRAEVAVAATGISAGAGAAASAAAPAMATLRATLDSTGQRGARRAPATSVLEETIPDPRVSAIGCRTVRFGEWSPALTGVRSPVLVALDSQRVAVGWRRSRLLVPADARAHAPGTWLVEGDSARIGLSDVGGGQSLRAAISLKSGAGAAMVLSATGQVRNRASASWAVEACPAR